ncbi:MAG: di-heme oxidoredictase family protein [Rikenellaceae bacterium]
MRIFKTNISLMILATGLLMIACSDDSLDENIDIDESNPMGYPDEYFAGGTLGTTTINGVFCFEQPSAAVSEAGLSDDFLHGEAFFEDYFTSEKNTGLPMSGRGPLSIRAACIDCHPGYGHGKRLGDLGDNVTFDTSDNGNGYLLVVYNSGADGSFGDASQTIIDDRIDGPAWTDHTSDNAYIAELTGMPQTLSVSPFPSPLDESKITIVWKEFVDEHDNKYADGTSYELIYPEVSIPTSAIYYASSPYFENINDESKYEVRLESTIGIYGTGLLDAITEADIDDEAASQANETWGGRRGAEITQLDGSVRKGRYTYALSRGTLQHGPGSNALWNITNVTRETSNTLYRTNYCTTAYANSVIADAEVMEALGNDSYYNFLIVDNDPASDASKNTVYNYLMWNNTYPNEKISDYTQYVDTEYQMEAELSLDEYTQFMVWHRGLAVPSVRNINSDEYARGKELFAQMSCDKCHRPTWTTGPDDYVGDADMAGKLPQYPYQKIWPYSDMLQHNLGMVNNIRTGWCRTTPLWGRYLNILANGQSSRLHDMRARNEEEAIMWHKGQGKYSSDQFRKLSADDRAAVVKFLQSI